MGFIRERDGRHQALYLDPQGRRRSAGTFGSARAARRALLDVETKKSVGAWVDPRDGRTTFKSYVEDVWLPNRLVRPSTAAAEVGHLDRHLLPAFGHLPLSRITTTSIQSWVTVALQAGAAPKTVRNIHGTLRTILRRAVIDRYRDTNPAMLTELPMVPTKVLRTVTPAQLDRLVACVKPAAMPLVVLLAASGMRWGESQALRVADYDEDTAVVTLARSTSEVSGRGERFTIGPTKNNRVRRLRLDPDAAAVVSAHIEEKGLCGNDLLVGASRDRPYSRGNFHNRVWRPAVVAAELEGLRVHDLRHTHATWLLSGGADLKVVMDRLGHSTLASAQRYVHAVPEADDVALEALARVRSR